ncbi:hypothetical protein [Nitrosococcus oceani]|uniref:Uncharacterized protein n=2 Tax=Nitrosococcus oceani TaxID=1229 RepID=Q3J903_NITOC|nr:hypothetical protein [Nitrosococcus oceani]ABA58693.1 conserved hypothetical protein [Nitrosococcus oceani ATCC 19707]EDZ68298.1 hypothetical protein NOC27_1625 [Nitrosococcus oceani AFC27]GEM19218.1 hypothetical protein NONS58_05970 [Nitrosococcus oceani]
MSKFSKLSIEQNIMKHDKDTFEKLLDNLKQQRDELRVQVHLAKLEAQEEWEEVEKKWDKLKPTLDAIRDETIESSKNIFASLGSIAEEIESGYKRIKKHLE